MPLLIDTYNVLHTVGVLPPDMAGIDVAGLVDLLEISRYHDDKITLACDGLPDPAANPPPAAEQPPGITIRYSGRGKPADDLIRQHIRLSSAPRRLTVVSSDHEIQRAARKRRCKVLSSHEFLQQLVDDARADRGEESAPPARPPASSMTQQQVDRWMSVFQFDSDMAALESQAEAAAKALRSRGAHAPQARSGAGAAPGQTTPPAAAHQPADQPPPELPPGVTLPRDLVAEAERLWAEHTRKLSSPPTRPTEADD